MSPLTARRVIQYPWQFWQIFMIGVGSAWQIYDSSVMAQMGASIANLAGAIVCLVSMVIRDRDHSRSVERWGYFMLLWSMGLYLSLALQEDGWWGLVNQPNFGVLLTEAVLLAALHRMIWVLYTTRANRKAVKRCNGLIDQALKDFGPTDARALEDHDLPLQKRKRD